MLKPEKFLVIAMTLLITLTLIGCAKRTALTADQFANYLEASGFKVENRTEQIDKEWLNTLAVAVNEDETYQIEFYDVSPVHIAEELFAANKATFKDHYSGSYASVSAGNFSTYSATSDGTYAYISRIDNTFIYVVTDIKYKNEIKDVVKGLGY